MKMGLSTSVEMHSCPRCRRQATRPVDGRFKVTGGARYAYEMQQNNVLLALWSKPSIGKGTIRRSTPCRGEGARRRAGLTHHNAPARDRHHRERIRCSPGRK